MINANEALIALFCRRLRNGYRRMYGHLKRDYEEIICWVGRMALEYIANSDALYHNAEHTFLVTLVGQEILRGKHMRQGGVTPEDWLHFMVSLACHDIGYVKGVCRQDRREESQFAAGRNGAMIALPPGSSDASLTPYHVDRGKLFVEERFGGHALLDAEIIKKNIELTRFPVPAAEDHRDTTCYPGLVRAADLVGQLSDPRYLRKTAALFYEFEETGTNKILGYRDPGDLRKNYPKFYWQAVSPYIGDALGFLELTQEGKQVIANLHNHVFVVEHERRGDDWIGKLSDRDRYVRMQAAAALGQMGPQACNAVPALIKALADEDESVRQWTARALGQIGAETAVEPLRRALDDDNAFVRIKAAEALWDLKDSEELAIPALVAVLGQSGWLAVREAAFTLGRIGPRATVAVPALTKAVCHSTSEVRKAAVEALRKIDPTAVIKALIGALHCDDCDTCAGSADGLGELGSAAAPAVPALVGALDSGWWMVRRAATEALGLIGPEARNAVSALTVELQDDHVLVRQAAAEALGRIGPDASESLSALEEAVKDRDDDVSQAASEALRKVRVARRVGV